MEKIIDSEKIVPPSFRSPLFSSKTDQGDFGKQTGGTPQSSYKKIASGDILLFKPGGDFLSRVIAWGTRSPYCHVAVCVSGETNLAIEANTRGGVRAIDLNKIERDFDVYRVKEGQEFQLEGVKKIKMGTATIFTDE